MRIAKEEIFGPVVTVNKFSTTEEAISIANEIEYGLVCAVFSKDTTEAMRVARYLDAGMIFLNNYNRMALGTPFGGTKFSGYGREHCIETLKEYTWAKNMRYPTGLGVVAGWSRAQALVASPINGKL
jgi:acyl-CoA reductase-like NAD-dependent aldehyde dehydrogenase